MIKIITEGQEELVFKIDIKSIDQQIKMTQYYCDKFYEMHTKNGLSERDIFTSNMTITWDFEEGEISVKPMLLEFPKYRNSKGTLRMCPSVFGELQDTFYQEVNAIKDDPRINDAIVTVKLSNPNSSVSVGIEIDLTGEDEEKE